MDFFKLRKYLYKQRKRTRKTLAYTSQYLWHAIFLRHQDKLLVNSIQKSGTHLLTNAINNSTKQVNRGRGIYNHVLTRQWPDIYQDRVTSNEKVIAFLENEAFPGEIVRGHVEYEAALSSLMPHICKHILIIRHPREVLISLANWWLRHNEVPAIPYLVFDKIESDEEKLDFLISGQYRGKSIWPDFVTRFSKYKGWLEDRNCLVIRFEALFDNRDSEVKKIELFLEQKINPIRFKAGMNPKISKTYTQPESKVFQSLSDNSLNLYNEFGGLKLEKDFGY